MRVSGRSRRPRGDVGLHSGKRTNGRSGRTGRWRKSKKTLSVLIIAALLILVVLLSVLGNGAFGAGNAVGTIFSPVMRGVHWLTGGVDKLFTKDDSREVKLLREQLAQAQSEALRLSEVEKENDRLRGLLDSTERMPDFEFLHAAVIGSDPGLWYQTLLINRGQKDGVAVNMAVVVQEGLVGRVVELGYNWARVMTLVDTGSAVSGIIERTRDKGVVKGNLILGDETEMCRMQYLPTEAELNPGDRVLTSGLDGVYPKGLVIGEIVEVGRQQENKQRYAVVNPTVDFQHLEDVMVLVGGVQPLENIPTPAPTPTPTPQPRPSHMQGPPVPTPSPTPAP